MESIAKTEVERKLLTLCEKELEPKGYRVVDLDCRIGGRSLLRVFIERLGSVDTSAQVTLDDCVAVSRALNESLESFDGIPGAFDLEVSSPGLDRRLRLQSDFAASAGSEVQLKLVESLEGVGSQVRGTVLEVNENNVLVGSSGKEIAVPWKKIRQANRVWKME